MFASLKIISVVINFPISILKPRCGPKVKILLSEVRLYEKFTSTCKFFGTIMTNAHKLIETGNGLRISNKITMTDPLTFLWARLVAKKVADSVPKHTATLVEIAKARKNNINIPSSLIYHCFSIINLLFFSLSALRHFVFINNEEDDMKLRNLSLLCVVAGFSTAAMATSSYQQNQVTLVNASQSGRPMHITYRLEYQNPGEAPVLGAIQSVSLQHNETVFFNLRGYKLAGIVPLSIDKIVLPSNANAFDLPEQCSLTTDEQHPSGKLTFALHGKYSQGGHGTCSVQGGIFS